MDDIINEFIIETYEMLEDLDVDLVKLEQDPSNEELLGKIFRLMHTIKGTCGFLNLNRLEKVAHSAENLLDHFRNGTILVDEVTITHVLVSIDRVRLLMDQIEKNGKESEGSDDDIINGIEGVIADYLGGKEASGTAVPDQENEEAEEATLEETEETDAIQADELLQTIDPALEETEAETAEAPTEKAEAPAAKKNKAEQAQAKPTEKAPEYLRVQVGLLEDIVNQVSELVLTRNQLFQQLGTVENQQSVTTLERLNRNVSDLQEKVMKTRMQPIGNAWTKLPRIVRDICKELEKDIELVMSGEETELDRQVLELIKDPLTHMIRNSCDHGVETPQEREKAGKPAKGTIHLSAYHEGGFIIIKIEDDGKGIDPQMIARKAIEKGLLEEEKAATLSDKELYTYIMAPGFSTAQTITNISGRGVGMDVVQKNIEQIGGTIEIDSVPGKKSVFTIHIPLTLAIISALIIKINNQRYAIPQMNIKELVSFDRERKEMIEYIDHKPVLRLRNRIIPLIDSNALFKQEKPSEKAWAIDADKSIAVMSAGSTYYGIIVDKVYDIEEVVIKSISRVLQSAKIYAGNTIMGDGSVVMILDPGAVARECHVEKDLSQSSSDEKLDKLGMSIKQHNKMLLFKAGSDAIRALPLDSISRLQEFPAEDISLSDNVYVVKHGEKLLQLCHVEPHDETNEKLSGMITSLIFADDRSDASFGLIVDEIVDVCDLVNDINNSTARTGVIGTALFEGKIADILDITHYMKLGHADWYASKAHSYSSFKSTTEKPSDTESSNKNTAPVGVSSATLDDIKKKALRVLAVDDSNFFRSVLKPMLVAAGFRVVVCESAKEAIALHDDGEMFDLIISDIEMPEMDGYDFVEKMRADSRWKDIPFAALTSHQTPDDIAKGKEKGFNSYIGKLDKDLLIQGIMEALHMQTESEAVK